MRKITLDLVSQSAIEYDTIPYTGNNGTYVSAVPDQDSKEKIVKVAAELGIVVDPKSLHVTIVYNKDQAKPLSSLPSVDAKQRMFAVINKIDHWVGHNDKTYIVMKLNSPAAIILNADFNRAGVPHSYIPFEPHISLSDDIAVDADMEDRIKMVNNFLAYDPITLYLIGINISDMH